MIEWFAGLDARTVRVLYELYGRGPLTKRVLRESLNLKLTTLNRTMELLEERGLVVPLGEAESTGGRRAALYDLAHRGLYLIGADLSRTYVRLVLTNLKLSVLQSERFWMDGSCSPEKTADEMAAAVGRMLGRQGIAVSQVLAAGIGTVGPMDRERGILLSPQGFFSPDWGMVPLKELLERRLSIPCVLDNGANSAVLAEYRFGAARGLRSAAYIHCGAGIRSAVLRDGEVIRTLNNREDAFGHMLVRLTETGETGSIESLSAMGAVFSGGGVRSWPKSERHSDGWDQVRTGAELFGIGLSNFVRLLSPQLVILGGPLMMNLEEYYRLCLEAFHRYDPGEGTIRFSRGGLLGENSIAVGSAAMALEENLRAAGKNFV